MIEGKSDIPTCTIEYTIDPTQPGYEDVAEENFLDNDMFTFNTNEKGEIVTKMEIPAGTTRNELADALFDMHITYNILDKAQLEEQGFTFYGSEDPSIGQGTRRICKLPDKIEKATIRKNQEYITNAGSTYKAGSWEEREYFVEYKGASYYLDEDFFKTLDLSHLIPQEDDLLY